MLKKSGKAKPKKRMRPNQYKTGYKYGESWIEEFGNVHPAPLPEDWPEDYRAGFVDGYNDTLECMRIE